MQEGGRRHEAVNALDFRLIKRFLTICIIDRSDDNHPHCGFARTCVLRALISISSLRSTH